MNSDEIFARSADLRRTVADFDRANDVLSRKRAQAPVVQTVATLRDRATSRAVPPGGGPRAPFTDLLVHDADMRVPLGVPFSPDLTDLAVALEFLTRGPRGFVSSKRLDGIRLAPTDVDGAWGDGAELTGSAADILLAVCGRQPTLERLGGPGKDVLVSRN